MSTPKIIGTSHSIVQRDGQTYIAVDGMRPDQIITWMHDHQRAQAFAAIRRAVEIARLNDENASVWLFLNHTGAAQLSAARADAIRQSIRAAIGSPKA